MKYKRDFKIGESPKSLIQYLSGSVEFELNIETHSPPVGSKIRLYATRGPQGEVLEVTFISSKKYIVKAKFQSQDVRDFLRREGFSLNPSP
jgi:hypothetical protein